MPSWARFKSWHVLRRIGKAARKGDVDKVRVLLATNRETLKRQSGRNYGALHQSAENGHSQVVELLLEHGYDVNSRNRFDITPLHMASSRGHGDTAYILIDRGANANARSRDGNTPLHWAASHGHKHVAQLLIEQGANLDVAEETFGNTPLHNAAKWNHKEVVEGLLNAGANAGTINLQGDTAMGQAGSGKYLGRQLQKCYNMHDSGEEEIRKLLDPHTPRRKRIPCDSCGRPCLCTPLSEGGGIYLTPDAVAKNMLYRCKRCENVLCYTCATAEHISDGPLIALECPGCGGPVDF